MPHLRSTLFTLLVAVALMLGACRDGSNTPPMALDIVNINPTGLVGTPGQEVQFVAMVDDATVTTAYAWSVTSGGGTWDDSSAEQPTLTLGSAGTYTVTLLVTDGGDSDTQVDSITVSATPVVTGVVLDPASGLPLGIGTATATVVGEYDDVEWDFGGGGSEEAGAVLDPGEASTPIEFLDAGTYEAQVRVHGSGGWGDWEPFEVEVGVPVAPEWTQIELGAADFGIETTQLTMCDHNGKLAILYNSPDGLSLALATVDDPASPADFATHVVDSAGKCSVGGNIVSSEDRLVLFYGRPGAPSYEGNIVAVSDSSTPNEGGDWTISILTFYGGVLYRGGSSLLVREEGLALLTAGGSYGGVFASTGEDVPDEAEDWTTYDLKDDSGFFGSRAWPALTEIDGRLYASYFQETVVKLARAESSDPESDTDWDYTVVALVSEGQEPRTSLAVWAGAPVIYHEGRDTTIPALGAEAMLSFASSSEPTGIPSYQTLQLSAPGEHCKVGGFAQSQNRFACVYRTQEGADVVLARAISSDPTSLAGWETTRIAEISNYYRTPTTLTVLGDRLVVAWVDLTTGTLKVAIAQDIY